MSEKQKIYDVIIVGSGLAGLAAAREINRTELSYTVLEASERSGGKVHSGSNSKGEFQLELGAQFVNKDMTEMGQFIEESGQTLVETHAHPNSVFLHAKTMKPVGDLISTLDEDLLKDFGSSDLSLSEAIDELTDTEDKAAIVKSFMTEETTVEADYISAESYIDTSERYASDKDDLTHQASGSLSEVIDHLVDSLKETIHYKQILKKVDTVESGYALTTQAGNTFQTKAIILAIPPTVAQKISLPDELTKHFRPYLTSFVDGSVIKVTLSYADSFWKAVQEEGETVPLEGIVYSEYQGMTVSDSSKKGDTPRLTAFIGGELAKNLAKQTAEEREQFVMQRLHDVLGDTASNYLDYRESVWVNHPYCGGGYSAQVHVDAETDAPEQLRQPFKKVVFASTELAEAFPGFMEGAVRAGKLAANRLVAEIQ